MVKKFNRLRSTGELWEYIGTALSWIKNKNMPIHKIGRFGKFKFDKIDAWAKAGGAKED